MVKEKMMVGAVLKRSGDKRYVELKLSIIHQFAFGIDKYSGTLNGVYDLLENHSMSMNLHPRQKTRTPRGFDEEEKISANEGGGHLQGIQFTQGQGDLVYRV